MGLYRVCRCIFLRMQIGGKFRNCFGICDLWRLNLQAKDCGGLRVFILEKCSETFASQMTSQGLENIEGLGLYFPTQRTVGCLSYFSFPWETSTDSFSATGTSSCWLQVSYRGVSPFLLKAEPRRSLLTETHSLRQGILKESKLGLGRGQSGKGRWVKFGYFQICNKASNRWVNILGLIQKRGPGWKDTLRSRVVGTWMVSESVGVDNVTQEKFIK